MGEITSAISESIRNRAASVALITYSIFYAGFHWQRFYAMLFVDEEIIFSKFGLLKNEYLDIYFFGWRNGEMLWGILIPLALTIIFIWPFQRHILIKAYKIEQENKTERRKVKLVETQKIEKFKSELIKEESKTIKAEKVKIDAEKELSESKIKAAKTDPTILWDNEFKAFEESHHSVDLDNIINIVYQHNGYYQGRIDADSLAYFDAEGLIKIDPGSRLVDLTEKGKYFVKRSQ